tara:strand:- start:966 stop:1781 length:816 start_codon:yes stop_codon:yes gene_type:complete
MERFKKGERDRLSMGTTIFPDSVRVLQEDLARTLSTDELTPEVALRRGREVHKSIERSAERASLAIETDATYPFFKSKNRNLGRRDYRRLQRELLENHREAWQYAQSTVGEAQRFSHRDLSIIGRILVPHQELSLQTGFRKYDVQITGASHSAIHPSRIQAELQGVIDEMEGWGPLEKSIYSHFHIARIHPFEDGNGRTARIVQDSLMCGAGHFPIVVHPDDRDLYITMLDEGVVNYKAGKPSYLRTFSEFLVQKTAKQLESIQRRTINKS